MPIESATVRTSMPSPQSPQAAHTIQISSSGIGGTPSQISRAPQETTKPWSLKQCFWKTVSFLAKPFAWAFSYCCGRSETHRPSNTIPTNTAPISAAPAATPTPFQEVTRRGQYQELCDKLHQLRSRLRDFYVETQRETGTPRPLPERIVIPRLAAAPLGDTGFAHPTGIVSEQQGAFYQGILLDEFFKTNDYILHLRDPSRFTQSLRTNSESTSGLGFSNEPLNEYSAQLFHQNIMSQMHILLGVINELFENLHENNHLPTSQDEPHWGRQPTIRFGQHRTTPLTEEAARGLHAQELARFAELDQKTTNLINRFREQMQARATPLTT